jgi:hypothetical protein
MLGLRYFALRITLALRKMIFPRLLGCDGSKSKLMKRTSFAIALLLILTITAESCIAGTIASVAEFSGQFSEGFENFPYGDVTGPADQEDVSGPVAILDGRGSLSGRHALDLRPLFIWGSNNHSLDDLGPHEGHVVAVSHDGDKGLTLQPVLGVNPIGRIEFTQPISRFGGYWLHAVTRDEAGPIAVRFFDDIDSLIGESQFDYDYADLQGISQWFGWESDRPIYAIEFTGFWAAVDGIQADVVPEPRSALLMLLGFVLPRVSRPFSRC